MCQGPAHGWTSQCSHNLDSRSERTVGNLQPFRPSGLQIRAGPLVLCKYNCFHVLIHLFGYNACNITSRSPVSSIWLSIAYRRISHVRAIRKVVSIWHVSCRKECRHNGSVRGRSEGSATAPRWPSTRVSSFLIVQLHAIAVRTPVKWALSWQTLRVRTSCWYVYVALKHRGYGTTRRVYNKLQRSFNII